MSKGGHQIVLYPGTFDPITNGHVDIIDRAARIFDEVIITIAVNRKKETLFTADERVDLIRRSLSDDLPDSSNISVEKIDTLLVDFAKRVGAVAIVRGLRTLGDFEYEMQMALMNRKLHPGISTFFMAADERYIHLNSSIVREIAKYGAALDDLVPEAVAKAMKDKF